MKKKLHIPGPKEEAYFGTELSVFFSILIFLGIAWFFSYQAPIEHKPSVRKESDSARQRALKADKKISRRFEKMSEEELDEHAWSESDLQALFLFGPTLASESACEKNKDAILSGTFSKKASAQLEKAVKERRPGAPWRCLTTLLLQKRLPEGTLKTEVESFFIDLEAMKIDPRIVGTLLDYFRENRVRVKSPRFHTWLQRCGSYTTYKGGISCRRYLKTLSPKWGRDVLESMQMSLAHNPPSEDDYSAAIHSLGLWVRKGQPKSWNVKESKKLVAYDIDFRIGAVLSLCRFTMSDGGKLKQQAIDELSKSAEVQMRANLEIQAERWSTTCDLMFGGHYEDDQTSKVLLTRKREEDKPAYDISFLINNGYCPQKEGYPTWYCAVQKWIHGDLPILDAMSKSFIETRFMQFPE